MKINLDGKRVQLGKINYPDCMDKECIELCDAINSFPGMITGESCCGHGEKPYYIIFYCDNVNLLSPLLGCIPTHLSYDWRAIIRKCIAQSPFFVMLEGTVGGQAYKEAHIISKSIYRFLKTASFRTNPCIQYEAML